MSEILTDLSSPDLIPALKYNCWRFFTGYGLVPESEFYSDSYLTRFFTGISHPLLNGVFNTQIPLEKIESTIQETANYFRIKGVPAGWWIEPDTQPDNLGEYLQSQGLNYMGSMPVMAIDLSILPEEQDFGEDLVIAQVEDITTLEKWSHIAAICFEVPPDEITDYFQLELNRCLTSPEYIRLIGYWQGLPVATSAIYLDSQVAGLYIVATLPEARGKGIATALVSATLQKVRQLGYHIATLQASEYGVNIYRRLGFQEFYQVHIYY